VTRNAAALPRSSVIVPVLIVMAAAAALAVAGLLIARRRRRHKHGAPPDPGGVVVAPDDDHIVVDHLSKTYATGFIAVDDVSFRVGAGQVFGLLGPNGAGKTTALRMMLGLIGPTSGTITVLGERMRPGHPVLARVGALVEGPGFAPYLSGIDNLRSYWTAGGGDMATANMDAALAVADLGEAVHRPVRTYSHGMKQRLGIAQALLGDPKLLILDEPTDGLDPGQIKAMRQLLAELAAQGRTILVSSHLLAEVEQVCTHAAVMNRGRLITAGAVRDLVAATQTFVVSTPESEQAQRVAVSLVGSERVRLQPEGVAVDFGGTNNGEAGSADLLGALVAAGATATSRRCLFGSDRR
jgi:ABC-2 type transport system ATP-binding protein